MKNYTNINLLVSKFPREDFAGEVFGGQTSDYQPALEQVVYQASLDDSSKENSSFRQKVSKTLKNISLIFLSLGLVSTSAVIFPQVSEFVDDRLSSSYVQIFTKPTKTFGDNLVATGDKEVEKLYQPVVDPTLGKENRLIIDEIGVDAKLNESTQENVEEALREGVWRVSEFGTPYGRKRPTILAAHRFGFLDWSNDFRKKNSFYSLPKLQEGDSVEIIWASRRYLYEVYDIEEGAEILDYQADLILYTCKFLDAETRIFVYAKLLEI